MAMNIIKDNMLNLKLLMEAAQKPAIFSAGEELFWDDPHISKQMLEAHLNPEWDAASYRHETIDRSVEWLVKYLKLQEGARILDLGCGPGLYCTRFCKHGFDVTGMDYSRNSIEYASKYVAENALDIRYIYQNYLTMDYYEEFDAILIISCDLGALTVTDQDILLGKIYKALKPDGVFVFDVFTRNNREWKSSSNWYVSEAGFWRPGPHLVLERFFHYEEENALLRQYTVIADDGRIVTYKLRDYYYSVDTVSQLLKEHGFAVQGIWSDLTGKPYEVSSGLLGIVAGKGR